MLTEFSKIKTTFSVLFFLVLLPAPFFVQAHTEGSSWEVPAGKYIADVGYDPAVIVAGNYTRFDLNLEIATDVSDPGDFAEVWVRIKDSENTYLATGIRKQSLGPTTLLYLFAKPGSYTLDASFRDADGHEIGAASFPITVEASAGDSFIIAYGVDVLLVLVGMALGIALGILPSISKKLRKS